MATEQEHRKIAQETDRQLVARFVARRDELAFREIVRRHGPLVLGVCRRVVGEVHEAEDAFQATFLVLARDARKIRRRKSLSCWLHGVAYRISVRVAKRKSRHMDPLPDDQADDRPSVLEYIAHRHDQRMVDEELNKLPEKERESLALRYLEDCSNSEIANTLDISVSAVEGRLKRARDRLRRQLLRRGVSLSVFLGVLAESRIEVQAVESLISSTVELGLVDAASELLDSSAAHQLAVTEIGEMAMSIKQAVAIAAVTVMTVGLGMYGLSEHVVGQESTAKIAVPGASDEPADVEVKLVPTRSEQPAVRPQSNDPFAPGYRPGGGGEQPAAGPQPSSRATAGRSGSPRLRRAQAIAAALDDAILLEFSDAPLSEVVDYLKAARDIPIVIDCRALENIGLAGDTPVTVSLSGISFRSAFALMLAELDLDYVIRNEVLMITTKEAAETQLDPRAYVIDGFEIDPEELVKLITSMVASHTWEEQGGSARISFLEAPKQALVIAQTEQIHDQIADFLEKLRQAVGE